MIQAYFEGGEPLIKPGFDAIIRAASGSMMTLMRTHGWGLTAKVAATLADAGLGRVLVDLMGADPTTHESATGITGSFAKHATLCGTAWPPEFRATYWLF